MTFKTEDAFKFQVKKIKHLKSFPNDITLDSEKEDGALVTGSISGIAENFPQRDEKTESKDENNHVVDLKVELISPKTLSTIETPSIHSVTGSSHTSSSKKISRYEENNSASSSGNGVEEINSHAEGSFGTESSNTTISSSVKEKFRCGKSEISTKTNGDLSESFNGDEIVSDEMSSVTSVKEEFKCGKSEILTETNEVLSESFNGDDIVSDEVSSIVSPSLKDRSSNSDVYSESFESSTSKKSTFLSSSASLGNENPKQRVKKGSRCEIKQALVPRNLKRHGSSGSDHSYAISHSENEKPADSVELKESAKKHCNGSILDYCIKESEFIISNKQRKKCTSNHLSEKKLPSDSIVSSTAIHSLPINTSITSEADQISPVDNPRCHYLSPPKLDSLQKNDIENKLITSSPLQSADGILQEPSISSNEEMDFSPDMLKDFKNPFQSEKLPVSPLPPTPSKNKKKIRKVKKEVERVKKEVKKVKKEVKEVNKKIMKSEESKKDIHPLDAAFNELEKLKFSEKHYKLNVHSLVNVLMNPTCARRLELIVFYVTSYLLKSKRNPLLAYFSTENNTLLMPIIEKCIVTALVQMDHKMKSQIQGFLKCIAGSLFYFALLKLEIPIYGLSACCRVFADICKTINDKRSPLLLCSKLLKSRNVYSPYLVATIAGVWPDLFQTNNSSDIEKIFFDSLSSFLSAKNVTTGLNGAQLKHSSSALSDFLGEHSVPEISKTIEAVKKHIDFLIDEGSLCENGFMVSTPLLFFANQEDSNWVKENLFNNYIVPALTKYSQEISNESAFKFFCYLYTDIYLLYPDDFSQDAILFQFFEKSLRKTEAVSSTDFHYVTATVATSAIKLCMHLKETVPNCIYKFMKMEFKNKDIFEKSDIDLICRQRVIFSNKNLSFEDCCILKQHLISSKFLCDL